MPWDTYRSADRRLFHYYNPAPAPIIRQISVMREAFGYAVYYFTTNDSAYEQLITHMGQSIYYESDADVQYIRLRTDDQALFLNFLQHIRIIEPAIYHEIRTLLGIGADISPYTTIPDWVQWRIPGAFPTLSDYTYRNTKSNAWVREVRLSQNLVQQLQVHLVASHGINHARLSDALPPLQPNSGIQLISVGNTHTLTVTSRDFFYALRAYVQQLQSIVPDFSQSLIERLSVQMSAMHQLQGNQGILTHAYHPGWLHANGSLINTAAHLQQEDDFSDQESADHEAGQDYTSSSEQQEDDASSYENLEELLEEGEFIFGLPSFLLNDDTFFTALAASLILNYPEAPPVPAPPAVNAAKIEEHDYKGHIPKRFICGISGQIMDKPVYFPTVAVRYNEAHIKQWIELKGTHPATRQKLTIENFVHDTKLQEELDIFMIRVTGEGLRRSERQENKRRKLA